MDIGNATEGLRRKPSEIAKRHVDALLKNMRFCGAVICSHYPWLVIGPWAG